MTMNQQNIEDYVVVNKNALREFAVGFDGEYGKIISMVVESVIKAGTPVDKFFNFAEKSKPKQ